jgi:hypothetical protein
MGWIQPAQEPEVGSCEFGNTYSYSMKGEGFILRVQEQFFRKDNLM